MSGNVQSITAEEGVSHSPVKCRTGMAQQARRQLFVSEFLRNGGNAKAAAIACHAAPKTAHIIGKRLLRHPWVIAELDKIYKKTVTGFTLTLQDKREKLAAIVNDPRTPVKSVISAILADSTLAGDSAPTKSQSLNISATIGPDGQITSDPFQVISPRLDAWRKIQQVRRPAGLISTQSKQDSADNAADDARKPRIDNPAQDDTARDIT